MFRQSYVVVDFSNLVYIAFFAAYRGKPDQVPKYYTEHVDYFKKCIASYRRWNGMAKFIYALDSRPEEKYRLLPGYKAGRQKLTHPDGTRFDATEAIKPNLGYAITIIAGGYEADDSIASFVAQHFNDEVTVITTDKDIWQISDHPNASVYDPLKKEFIGKHHVRASFCRKDKHKVIHEHLTEFAQIRLWKSLWGDSGDSVPNVVLRTKNELISIMAASDGSLEDFYDKVAEAKLSPKCRQKLKDAEEAILLNDKLVRLNYALDLETSVLNQPEVEEGPLWDENGEVDLQKIF